MRWVKISDEQVNKMIDFCKPSTFSITYDPNKKNYIWCEHQSTL